MNAAERKIVIALASILSFRMFGLFMILPVFALYAEQLQGVTPTLLGFALGIYGLTQALLQLPFGTLSDIYGRKPIILLGLLLFALGSVVAAMSHSITGVIIGRALQGAGAIGSVIMALVSDLTAEQHRPLAMAFLGISIGASFTLAMALGPLLNNWISVPGLFWLTAAMAVAGMVILIGFVPNSTQRPSIPILPTQHILSQFYLLLKNPTLLQLNIGIFILHFILTAIFVVIPSVLKNQANLPGNQQWHLFLPVIIIALFAALPIIRMATKPQPMKMIYFGAITLLAFSQLLLWQYHNTIYPIAVNLFLFFAAFTLLEAYLPALIAKFAPLAIRGSAMGIYSCSQFLGIFVGGTTAGWLMHRSDVSNVFLMCAMMACIWLSIAIIYKFGTVSADK